MAGKAGMPKKKINYKLVVRLANIHCTHEEIASVLGVSLSHLEHDKKFKMTYNNELSKGKASMRRMQWETAAGVNGVPLKDSQGEILVDDKGHVQWKVPPVAPSATMQIWLGKQLLGQRDQSALTGADGGPITIKELSDDELHKIIKGSSKIAST